MSTKVYGIAAVESPDRVGETILIKNIDTSRLRYINDEHDDTFFSILGGITAHKKILSANDAVSPRERKCWDKVKKPFLYIEGNLADDTDHPNAQAAAGLLKYCNQHPEMPLKVGFSIEGGIIQRSGENKKILEHTVGDGVSLTIKPCHPDVEVFLEKDLMKSHCPVAMPEKYANIVKEAGDFTPSFKETYYANLLEKVEIMKKSLSNYVDSMTSLQCKHCGETQRFFKSSNDWPNICQKCGAGFKMKQLFKALERK